MTITIHCLRLAGPACLEAHDPSEAGRQSQGSVTKEEGDAEIPSRCSTRSALASCPVFPEVVQLIQFGYHEALQCQVSPNTTMLLLILFLMSGLLGDNWRFRLLS